MPEFVTKEQRAAHIKALLAEQAAYEARGQKSRAAEVAKELSRLGDGKGPKANRQGSVAQPAGSEGK